MTKSLTAALAAFAALSFSASAWCADYTMRLSHQYPPAHQVAKALEQFAADVKSGTGGKVEVQLFGSEQLFKANQNHAAVARGQVEAAAILNFQWGATIPEMSVTAIPFLISHAEQLKKFPTSDAAALLNRKMEDKGVHNIAWMVDANDGIFTSAKALLVKPEDFKGVKIRGLNKLFDAGLIAMGSSPAAMPGSEVYQALQSGVLDAGLTDLSAAYSRKYYEIQKYGTVAPYFTVFFHVYVNPQWWSKLAPGQRQAIEAAAAKAEQDAFTVTEETAADALTQLKAKGMQIHVQTPAEQATWKAAMQQPVIDAFLKSAPQDGQKTLDLLKSL